mmetsp:Transcript_34219/g.87511  ORF Transcript_34219/g.87511 Transcript_34219/m.87511 type:complete len:532 (+) Transcript_34219:166-1761(+)
MKLRFTAALVVVALGALLAAPVAHAQLGAIASFSAMKEAAELCIDNLNDACDDAAEDFTIGEIDQDLYVEVCSQTCRTAIGTASACVAALDGTNFMKTLAESAVNTASSIVTVCDCCPSANQTCIAGWRAGTCGDFTSIGGTGTAGIEAVEDQLEAIFEPVEDACDVDVDDVLDMAAPNSVVLEDLEEYTAFCGAPCGNAVAAAKANMSQIAATNQMVQSLQAALFSAVDGLRTLCTCCAHPVNATCLASWRSGSCGSAPQSMDLNFSNTGGNGGRNGSGDSGNGSGGSGQSGGSGTTGDPGTPATGPVTTVPSPGAGDTPDTTQDGGVTVPSTGSTPSPNGANGGAGGMVSNPDTGNMGRLPTAEEALTGVLEGMLGGGAGPSGSNLQDMLANLESTGQSMNACITGIETACPDSSNQNSSALALAEYNAVCSATCQGAVSDANTCLANLPPMEGVMGTMLTEMKESIIQTADMCECCPYPVAPECMERVTSGACGSSALSQSQSDSAATPERAALWLLAGLLALVATLF